MSHGIQAYQKLKGRAESLLRPSGHPSYTLILVQSDPLWVPNSGTQKVRNLCYFRSLVCNNLLQQP